MDDRAEERKPRVVSLKETLFSVIAASFITGMYACRLVSHLRSGLQGGFDWFMPAMWAAITFAWVWRMLEAARKAKFETTKEGLTSEQSGSPKPRTVSMSFAVTYLISVAFAVGLCAAKLLTFYKYGQGDAFTWIPFGLMAGATWLGARQVIKAAK